MPLSGVERLGATALLAPHDVDGASVDERHDPRARLRALCTERGCRAPHGEERVLHGVLGEALVPEDAVRDPVGDPPDAVVQLGERVLVTTRDEGHEGFVGQVRVVSAHRPGGRLQRRPAPARRTLPRLPQRSACV